MPSWQCARCIPCTSWTKTDFIGAGGDGRQAFAARESVGQARGRSGEAWHGPDAPSGKWRRAAMQNRGGDTPRLSPSEPALRIILRRLREIMAEPSDGQSRLDKIVRQIAGVMVAEGWSSYLKRQDGALALFAPARLNPAA